MFSLNTLISAIADFKYIMITQSVLVVVMALMAIAMIAIVLMQKSSSDGIGAISGDTDTYYGKNKKQNKDKILKIVTISLGVVMVIVSIIFFVLNVLTI